MAINEHFIQKYRMSYLIPYPIAKILHLKLEWGWPKRTATGGECLRIIAGTGVLVYGNKMVTALFFVNLNGAALCSFLWEFV